MMSTLTMREDFNVNKFIGKGCYSLVYEVEKCTGPDKGTLYAFKKFFLLSPSAKRCVIRERKILERLANDLTDMSPFLPVLCYALWIPHSPIFVMNKGCGKDLYDLVQHIGYLQEVEAKFYISEVVLGLEVIHSLGIVHLDLKPENILFKNGGHIFIADFDRSYDMSNANGDPTDDDFTGTPLFMAPEIAKGQIISDKADIWSLAVLLAEMVSGPVRREGRNTGDNFDLAKLGKIHISNFRKLSKPLQGFFNSCLKMNSTQRPTISEVKNLRFFKSVNWQHVTDLKPRPPYHPDDIPHKPSKEDRKLFSMDDNVILDDAFSASPSINYGGRKLNVIEKPDCDDATDRRETPTKEEQVNVEAFRDFAFVHPMLRNKLEQISEENGESVVKEEESLDELEPLNKPGAFLVRSRGRTISVGE